MFFSSSLLTDRNKRSGFGVFWLASTVANRSSSIAKLTRKDILDADVSRAWPVPPSLARVFTGKELKRKRGSHSLANPPEPLALRLSSGIMLGIARVYLQKVTLFEVDVKTVSTSLKKSLNALHTGKSDMTGSLDMPSSRGPAINLPLDPLLALIPALATIGTSPRTLGSSSAFPHHHHPLLDGFGLDPGAFFVGEADDEYEAEVARAVGVDIVSSRAGTPSSGRPRSASIQQDPDKDAFVASPDLINLIEPHRLLDDGLDFIGGAPVDDPFHPFAAGGSQQGGREGRAEVEFQGFELDDLGQGILAGFDPQLDHDLGLGPSSETDPVSFDVRMDDGYAADAEKDGARGQARRKRRRKRKVVRDDGVEEEEDATSEEEEGTKPHDLHPTATGNELEFPVPELDFGIAADLQFEEGGHVPMDLDEGAAAALGQASPRSDKRKRPSEEPDDDEEDGGDGGTEKKKRRTKKPGTVIDDVTTLTTEDIRQSRDAFSVDLRRRAQADRQRREDIRQQGLAIEMIYGVPDWARANDGLEEMWTASVRIPGFGTKLDLSLHKGFKTDGGGREDSVGHRGFGGQGLGDFEGPGGEVFQGDAAGGMPWDVDFDRPGHVEQGRGQAGYESEVGRGRDSSQVSGGAVVPSSQQRVMPWNDPAYEHLSDTAGGFPALLGEPPSSASRFSRETPVRLSKRGVQRASSTSLSAFDQAQRDGYTSDNPLDFGVGFTGFSVDEGQPASTLERDGRKFLEWAREQVSDPSDFLFSDLAPVTSTTGDVAAHAFYKVLSLATRGHVRATQPDGPYEEIHLCILVASAAGHQEVF